MSKVRVEEEGPVRKIILSDVETRNSLSRAMLGDLLVELRRPAGDKLRAVILAADGPVFSSGHDFNDLYQIGEDEAQSLFSLSKDVMLAIRSLELPVIARLQGGAVGAGCQLALSCDFIVASHNAYLQTPGGGHGWFCFTPMVALSRAVGPKLALELLMSGEPVSSKDALAHGVLNRVVSESMLDQEVVSFVKKVTRGSREMLALGKRSFYEQLSLSELEAYQKMTRVMADTSQMNDAQERIRKFVERRKGSKGEK